MIEHVVWCDPVYGNVKLLDAAIPLGGQECVGNTTVRGTALSVLCAHQIVLVKHRSEIG